MGADAAGLKNLRVSGLCHQFRLKQQDRGDPTFKVSANGNSRVEETSQRGHGLDGRSSRKGVHEPGETGIDERSRKAPTPYIQRSCGNAFRSSCHSTKSAARTGGKNLQKTPNVPQTARSSLHGKSLILNLHKGDNLF